MKIFIVGATIFFVFAYPCLSQESDSMVKLPLKDGKIFYEQVVEFDSTVTKDKIYLAIKQWFAETFKDSKSVIQIDDKAKILGKGTISKRFDYSTLEKNFTINSDIKDAKYRVQIYDFYFRVLLDGVDQFSTKVSETLYSYDDDYRWYLASRQNNDAPKKKKKASNLDAEFTELDHLLTRA